MASGDRKLRWAPRYAASAPTEPGASYRAIDGYYIWLASDDEPTRSWDAVYAQRLALLAHHPGFRAHIECLRTEHPGGDLAVAAAKWQITVADLTVYLEDRDSFDAFGDKIFVELRPDQFLVHVPRPLTSARSEALRRWTIDTRRWPHLHEWNEGGEWQEQRDAHLAPTVVARLDWYDRWQSGEQPRDIANSLPEEVGTKLPEEHIRTTLQHIHRQLQRISPEGLKSPGP